MTPMDDAGRLDTSDFLCSRALWPYHLKAKCRRVVTKVLGTKTGWMQKPNMISMSRFIQILHRKPGTLKGVLSRCCLHCKYHSGLPNYQRSDRSTGNAIHLIGSTAGGSSQIAHCTGATAAPLSDSPEHGPIFVRHFWEQALFLKSACSKFITSHCQWLPTAAWT